MGSAPSQGTTDYSQLTDEKLVKLLPTRKEDKCEKIQPQDREKFEREPENFLRPDVKHILDVLWWRHHSLGSSVEGLRFLVSTGPANRQYSVLATPATRLLTPPILPRNRRSYDVPP